MLDTWQRHGGSRIVLEDAQQQRLGWRALFTRAFILADLLENAPRPTPAGSEAIALGRNVALLLPNTAAAVIGMLALHLRGRVPVILNFTAGIHDEL